jgi:CHAD domain-containing protein
MIAPLEYLAPEDIDPGALAEGVTPHFKEVHDGSARRLDRTYYDTFDGLLHRAGLTLASGDGALELAERATGTVRARATNAPARFAFELPPGPLRDALSETVDVRALLPLARVRTREHRFRMLDDERKTVVRMALDEPALVKPPRALRPRLRVEAVRGYDEELERACAALENEIGCTPADEPLVDEAVRAAGGVVGGVSSKPQVGLEPEQRADIAAAAVLRALLRVIEANYDGTIGDVDSEFLHDLRVAVRRTRAVQRELRSVFAPGELAHFRAEFRWLQQVTGDARDLDVYVLEFDRFRVLVPDDMRGDLEPVLGVLRERRRVARRKMVRALRSARTARLLHDWDEFLAALSHPAPPISELAGARIRKVYRRMVRMGDAIEDSSPAADYHELRKKGKELRYLLELFGVPLYPREVVAPMVKALKGLQDVLGRHQDREVQVAMLRSLREELVARPGGTGALMATGALVARLEEDERLARAAFSERFAEFASRKQRRLVRDTFA